MKIRAFEMRAGDKFTFRSEPMQVREVTLWGDTVEVISPLGPGRICIPFPVGQEIEVERKGEVG
jgi:hypothetical protein